MRKIILIVCIVFAGMQYSNAQIQFGIKGGVNYNSNSIKEVSTDVFDGAKSKTGYHLGIWTRFKIPVIGLYLRPELVYTKLSNEITYLPKTTAKSTTYDFQKIDIPLLLGKKIFSVGNIYFGPSFQYILNSDFSISDISDVETNDFSMGIQFGGGIELGKLGIDVRWERSISKIESKLFNSLGSINYDTRINQIIIGLSYRL